MSALRNQAAYSIINPPLRDDLTGHGEDLALAMFRAGQDTVAIAWDLRCTPAAAANGLANARERERAR